MTMITASAASSATTKGKDTSYINNVPKNLYKASGRWLILPKIETPEELQEAADKVHAISKNTGSKGFKGSFIPTTSFGKHIEGDRIPFTLLNSETSVGQIKIRISELTSVPASEIMIGFHGKRDLDNKTNFQFDLNCHGKGGENFWISQRKNKSNEIRCVEKSNEIRCAAKSNAVSAGVREA